jgi:hypothetical protein
MGKIGRKTISSEDFERKWIGKIIGNMEVLSYGEYKNGRHLCKTKCLRCGSISNRRVDRISKKPIYCKNCKTDACKQYNHLETAFNNQYKAIKSNALSRKIEFNLSKKEVFRIINENCFYCGQEPCINNNSKYGTKARKTSEYKSNGIDRIDSSKPYNIDNVVACCSVCNLMKNKFSKELFFEKVALIYNNHLSK